MKRRRQPRKTRGNVNNVNPKPLTRLFAGGPPAHNEAVKNINDEERLLKRRHAAYHALKDERLTFREIGKRFGVSGKTAWEDVQAYRRLIQHEYAVDGDMHRHRILANLSRIYRIHDKKVASQASAKVLLEVLAQERKLLGLDLQDLGQTYTADQVMRLIASMMKLFTEIVADHDMRLQFATGVRGKVKAEMRAAVPVAAIVSTNGHPPTAK